MSNLSDFTGPPDWTEITNKPATYPPDSHGHAISEITSLETELNEKLPSTNPAISGSVTEEEYELTGTDINPSNGTVQYNTLTQDVTFTDGLLNGQFVTLVITNSGFTITYPTISWWEGTAPNLGATDKIYFEKINGTLYGTQAGSIT